MALAIFLMYYTPASSEIIPDQKITQPEKRGITDFDTIIAALENRGAWEKHEKYGYIFLPDWAKDTSWRPYRNGHWIYTDYGWTWVGTDEFSWATDHFGAWRKMEGKGWVWVPAGEWAPSAVEWLKSGDHFGWRPTPVDRFSNILDEDPKRFDHADQWNWAPQTKILEPLKPGDFADDSKSAELLNLSEPADHIFVTYREILRPGPGFQQLGRLLNLELPIYRLHNATNRGNSTVGKKDLRYTAYRPQFYQDDNGIIKRVEMFLKRGFAGPSTDHSKTRKVILERFEASEEEKAKFEEFYEKYTDQKEREAKHYQSLYD